MKTAKPGILPAIAALLAATAAGAHVPYFEPLDYSAERPFVVRNSIEQSIAVYAWLESTSAESDVDVYRFDVTDPVRVYLEVIVPVCPGYEAFLPAYALTGPGLPVPGEPLPFELPDGHGAVVLEHAPGVPRDTFFEPFGGKSYYQGPVFDQIIDQPGSYAVYYWDPAGTSGDYVAVLGADEIWPLRDILRALLLTPIIRDDRELHTECPDTAP